MTRTKRAWWERRSAMRSLRDVRLFAECSAAELTGIDALLTELRVPAGRVLMREGGRGLDFVVMAEGTVEITRDGERVGTIGPGSFLGELALLNEGPRTATATALTPLRIYVLNAHEFRSLLDIAPSVRSAVLEAAGHRSDELAHRAA